MIVDNLFCAGGYQVLPDEENKLVAKPYNINEAMKQANIEEE